MRHLRLAFPVILALFAACPGSEAADDFKSEKARYEAYMKRPSLYMRHRGRVNLAKTHDPRALAVLAKSYGRPEEPKDHVQYLLAAICADHFDDRAHVKALRAWRAKHAKPKDAWLWYRTLGVELKQEGPVEVIAAVTGSRPAPLRMAALLALAKAGDENALPVLGRLLDDLPARPFDRMLVLEAAAEVLDLTRKHVRSQPWREVAARLIPHLDAKSTTERTKLVLARRFARVWRTRKLALDAESWLARLERRAPKTKPAEEGAAYAPPKVPFFLGIQGTGRRVAYVIDLSDSMLTPLTGKEIEDLRRTPARPQRPRRVVTGGKEEGADPETKKAPEEAVPTVDLPWANIRTRFDAAREFLRLSLEGLGSEHSYCVVGFGSEAALLASTPGLRRATPSNLEKTIRELYAIRPGPKAPGRPYGTLRGYTNLHGGLLRAFEVRSRGLVQKHEHVDPDQFEAGCDTLFLLSDGKPTWDDWPMKDTLDPDNKPGDPEFGRTGSKAKTATFYGPYAIASWLLDDLRRLNLLRHVEIHCIGLGEYDPRLLDVVSRTGKGRFRRVGGGD